MACRDTNVTRLASVVAQPRGRYYCMVRIRSVHGMYRHRQHTSQLISMRISIEPFVLNRVALNKEQWTFACIDSLMRFRSGWACTICCPGCSGNHCFFTCAVDRLLSVYMQVCVDRLMVLLLHMHSGSDRTRTPHVSEWQPVYV